MEYLEIPLLDENGQEVKLRDFLGRWIVLYVYPKDNTPGCTMEAKEFTELLPEFEKLGVLVIGISKDSVESHRRFKDRHNLKVKLLSDPEVKLIRSLGAWGRKMRGEGVLRSTFIINPEGKIVWEKKRVKAKGHAVKVLEVVKELVKK
ncbi:peroxiredoxin [Thermococcus sp. SY098]|uniref:peroxiredoxin n=1 Tax=Thermococcus sp. SY098 TaxID=3111325 RepID=UPI002D77AAB4|nr:peroxiredoxin [Thermococcus sp. SY098]WRS52957.1 peroxiredoxin [Thermococcus sp. SY098]